MRKIGLTACYDTKNFGSQLQVLATIKELELLGFKTEIIRYRKKITPMFVKQTIPRLFNISFVKSKLKRNERDKKASLYPDIADKIRVRNQRFDSFVKKYFTNLSPVFAGWENLVKSSANRYDLFMCGSDQLWLPNNLGSHFYTLEFAPDDKPKISYATSFGVSDIPSFQRRNTARYLNRFSWLSTREIAGAKIIRKLTRKKAEIVCDPTMLFDGSEWLTMIPDESIIDTPYIFCYFLGKNAEHRRLANELRNKTGLKIVTIPFLDDFVDLDIQFGDCQLFDVDAQDFVNLIRHAQYILTDSFHGSVFSILYQKKFLTFDRFSNDHNSRNSRIESLCRVLQLDDRRCLDGDVLKIREEIDYSIAMKKLSSLRKKSEHFIIQSTGVKSR